jgi:hypothetical protein
MGYFVNLYNEFLNKYKINLKKVYRYVLLFID